MTNTPNAQEVPFQIVGSSSFGRYPMISSERTYNMFLSDEWLINFAGYQRKTDLNTPDNAIGRGIFHSVRGNFMLIVVGNTVIRINPNFGHRIVGTIPFGTTEVFIDENLNSQISIIDGANNYIYNYFGLGIFGLAEYVNTSGTPVTPDFIPNYVTFQNQKFVYGNGLPNTNGNKLPIFTSGFAPPSTNPLRLVVDGEIALQTKPDYAKAAVRIPSFGNNLLVLGTSVCELWQDVGGAAIYKRNPSINIDYGVASVSTIALSDNMVCWLGINEKSTPSIMMMAGGQAQRISTDGIDNLLKEVTNPDLSTAIFYRQDGHLFYILTFFGDEDNFSIMYDFNTKKFFDLTDWNFTYHPARQVAYFQNEIFFASRKTGDLMWLDTAFDDIRPQPFDRNQIPRLRICNTFRLPGGERFITNLLSFTIENGVDPENDGSDKCEGVLITEADSLDIYTEDDLLLLNENGFCQVYNPRIDMRISKNGGETWSNELSYYYHRTGNYLNQPRFHKLGMANQLTIQFRFWSFFRVAATNGVLEVYK